MKRIIFALSLCATMIFSCSQKVIPESNSQKISNLLDKHGIAPEQLALEVSDTALITDDQWAEFEEQLTVLGKGARLMRQVSVYTQAADPFIMEVVVNTKFTTEENHTKRMAIAHELTYTETGKSVKELLKIVLTNRDFFPDKLVTDFKQKIDNGIIKDAEFTKEDLLYIESMSQNTNQ